jgi:cyclase
VTVNTAAFENPELVREASLHFGAQCIVASIDVRRLPDGRYECFSHSGTRPTGREPVAWAGELERIGAGEILLTSVERDGMMQGYDTELTRRVAEAVNIPVIVSGGAGSYEHMFQALSIGKASAVAAASIFHFTQQTPLEAKQHLAARGIAVRNGKQLRQS